ncbi:MAG TPA: SGNH/GDSL hydrolase family protein [Ktedonobacterales bacterium]|nr:SGNH/GDSL hydrolase family protein [Ktedonobacterales bacterium]
MKIMLSSVILLVGSLLLGWQTPTAMAAPQKTRLLVVGDALSIGWDASEAQNTYVARVARALGAQVDLHAISDATTPMMYAALTRHPPARATIIIVELGTNDGGRDHTQFVRDYPRLLSLLRRVSPNALLVCSGPWQPHTGVQDVDAGNIQQFCATQGGAFVDLQRLFANNAYHWSARARVPWPNRISDAFHPDDIGMAAISAAFLAAIHSTPPTRARATTQKAFVAPTPLVSAIIVGSIGSFLIVLVFAAPISPALRKAGQRSRRPGVVSDGNVSHAPADAADSAEVDTERELVAAELER